MTKKSMKVIAVMAVGMAMVMAGAMMVMRMIRDR